MKNYRQIKKKDLKQQECICCNNHSLKMHIHHLDGNSKSNKKSNLICVCEKCHPLIHKGFTKLNDLDNEIKKKITYFRKIFLMNKKCYSEKEIDSRLRFELLRSSNGIKYIRKDICLICKKKQDLRLIVSDLVKRYERESRQHLFAVPICKDCLKSI